jgi:hypothetical protein
LPEIVMRRANSKKDAAVLPLGIKNRVKTELPALVALSAIGEPWFAEQHQSDLLAVALLTSELAPPGSLQEQCAAELQRLCSQTITLESKVDIALNLAECLPWLQLQSNTHIQRAIKTVSARSMAMAA